MAQVGRILKYNVGEFKDAAALNVHLAMSVYQNVSNRLVLEKRFQRAKAKNLLQHLSANTLFFRGAPGEVGYGDQIIDDVLHLGPRVDVLERGKPFQVDLVQQLAVQSCLQLLVRLAGRSAGRPIRD